MRSIQYCLETHGERKFDDKAWTRRVEGVIDAKSGLTAFFISKSDLIASKLAAGRLRDLADIEEIRESDASQPARARRGQSIA
jgi:hypothetical protein